MKSCEHCDKFRYRTYTNLQGKRVKAKDFGICEVDRFIVKIGDSVCSEYSQIEQKIDKLKDRRRKEFWYHDDYKIKG